MTGSPIYATNHELSAVDVESNSDEDVTAGVKVSKIDEYSDEMEIYLEEEPKMEVYKVKLNIDIENIENFENIRNNHKTHWRKIYEVIQQEFFDETYILLEEF